MKSQGVVFEIKEMAVFDGPGLRTTVFLKGCPLRCQWCHNPEGLSPKQELMVSQNGCLHCGRCQAACPHPEHCVLCGACVRACPNRLRKLCGTLYTPEALSALLLRDRDYLNAQGGGVTFSGGEPALQGDFLLETLDRLPGMHKAMETCGFCAGDMFQSILERLDYVLMDLKLIDEAKHQHYTGVDNRLILENLERLKAGGKPFVIRVPLIPGVNDGEENLRATALLLRDAKRLERVELLPYHKTAGAKYGMVGRSYQPEFETDKAPQAHGEIFHSYGIQCITL